MFEQSLYAVLLNHRAFLLNLAALLMVFAGSWLLIVARLRVMRGAARALAGQAQGAEFEPEARLLRSNRMFSAIGFAALALALLFSTLSTEL